MLTDPVLESQSVTSVDNRVAARRRRRRQISAGLGSLVAATAVAVGLPRIVSDGAREVSAGHAAVGSVVSDPGGGITLRYLPTAFELVDDSARNGPTRVRTITYSVNPAGSSPLIVSRSGSALDLAAELREQRGQRVDVNGRAAVLMRPTQGGLVKWAPADRLAVTLTVSSRDLSPDEILRVARGMAYDPARDDLPPSPGPGERGDGSDPIGPKVVVARSTDEPKWELVVYRSAAGLCVDVVGPSAGGGGGCSSEGMSGRALLGGQGGTRTPDGGFVQFVSGPARKDVAQVRVEFDAGPPLLLRPVGAEAGFGVNFYVALIPACRSVTAMVAADAASHELDRLTFGPRPQRPGQAPPTNCPPPGGG